MTAKCLVADDQLLKDHLIASECACFVSENILDLPEFLVNTNAIAFKWLIIDHTLHIRIFLHEVALEHLHELQANNQRYGNHCIVEDEVAPERDQS